MLKRIASYKVLPDGTHQLISEETGTKPLNPWQMVRDSWVKAQSFAASVVSLKDGIASDEIVGLRKQSCFGDDAHEACKLLVQNDTGSYCGGCGCPANRITRLDAKLLFPYLECPLKRPGFSNHEQN